MNIRSSRVWSGVKQHPLKVVVATYAIFAILFTAISALVFFIPALQPSYTTRQGVFILLGLCLLSGGIASYQAADRTNLKLDLTPIDTSIEISFGDLFQATGAKVIAVNEYFDSELGPRVAHSSLHGQVIQRYFEGQSTKFETAVDRSLDTEWAEDVSRSGNRTKSYPIGTTAVVEPNGQKFFLPALTKTDPQTDKAHCDLSVFTKAMSGLWETVRNQAQGETVTIPLLGSGQAQVGLPPQQLLQLIVMTIVEASRRTKITGKINIVLPPDCIEKIDLDAIDQHWR